MDLVNPDNPDLLAIYPGLFSNPKYEAMLEMFIIELSFLRRGINKVFSSNIEAKLKKDNDSTDVLFSGFPAGTVTGAPKIRAIQVIEELEKSKRNMYAGSVGFISNNGDINTCIALRSAFIKKNHIYVQAGAGIVADSIPKNEFKETESKALALLTACAYAKNFN